MFTVVLDSNPQLPLGWVDGFLTDITDKRDGSDLWRTTWEGGVLRGPGFLRTRPVPCPCASSCPCPDCPTSLGVQQQMEGVTGLSLGASLLPLIVIFYVIPFHPALLFLFVSSLTCVSELSAVLRRLWQQSGSPAVTHAAPWSHRLSEVGLH